jgi:hypothetical protein
VIVEEAWHSPANRELILSLRAKLMGWRGVEGIQGIQLGDGGQNLDCLPDRFSEKYSL